MIDAVIPQKEITGIILAGGRAQRMGGVDKGLIMLHGKPMIEHVIAALRTEIVNLLISANRNLDQYTAFGYPVIPDILEGYLGPLAGIASGMRAAGTQYIVTAPCDSPLVASKLVQRLYDTLTREDAEISVAHDGERMHPVFALMRRDLLPNLLDYLNAGQRKVDRWYAQHRLAVTYFDDTPESFRNVNSPEDRVELESRLGQIKRHC